MGGQLLENTSYLVKVGPVATISGFWSYVHADDDAEGGRIAWLARDIASAFELLTGESIDLFLDHDAIEWGDRWRESIDASLASVAFFIPALTPRYFKSAECRRELQFFARRATELGIKELVLPILYVDVAALHDALPADDLAALIRTYNWADWRDTRFAARDSEAYRRAVAGLAERLVKANVEAEQVSLAELAIERDRAPGGEPDESPGLLDRLAAAETAMPAWTETLTALGTEIQQLGQFMEEGATETRRADARGGGFAGRVAVARRLAQRLGEPSERIYGLGNEFASHMHTVDEAFTTIIQLAPSQVEADAESRTQICEFFQSLREMSHSVEEGLVALQALLDLLGSIESASRDLRPPLRRMRQGLTNMFEAREVTQEWIQLIDQTGIDCETDPQPQLEVNS
ncbi:MAG: TIR domain-containing protein [Actinomycetota bacterium]